MLTVEECKKYFPNNKLKDKNIILIRDYLYSLSNRVIEIQINQNKNGKK